MTTIEFNGENLGVIELPCMACTRGNYEFRMVCDEIQFECRSCGNRATDKDALRLFDIITTTRKAPNCNPVSNQTERQVIREAVAQPRGSMTQETTPATRPAGVAFRGLDSLERTLHGWPARRSTT